MTQEEFIAYIESKVIDNPSIDHHPEAGKEAFFVIDDPYDLEEFDNALRSSASFPAMLLEMGEGFLSDNTASSYTDTISASFMILDERNGEEPARNTRDRCLKIAKAILIQMRKDSNARAIVPGKFIQFRIDGIPYVPVGPMISQYYGYMVSFEFLCPFSF